MSAAHFSFPRRREGRRDDDDDRGPWISRDREPFDPICEQLTADPEIDASDLEVSVQNGEVTLEVHLRAILRDDFELFLGSPGMRTIELDRRREVGIVLRDRTAIKRFRDVFDEDGATTAAGRDEQEAA